MNFGKWPALAVLGVSLSVTPALADDPNVSFAGRDGQSFAKSDGQIPGRHLGFNKPNRAGKGVEASRFGRATADAAKARQPTQKRINHYVQREENSGFGRLIRSIRHPSAKRSKFDDTTAINNVVVVDSTTLLKGKREELLDRSLEQNSAQTAALRSELSGNAAISSALASEGVDINTVIGARVNNRLGVLTVFTY